MVFSTQIFMFVFFPMCMALFYGFKMLERVACIGNIFVKLRLTDVLLVFLSLFFYGWSGVKNVPGIILFSFLVYVGGKCLENYCDNGFCQECQARRNILALFVVVVVCSLAYFKYSGFLIGIWNSLFPSFRFGLQRILAPLGISFVVFSAISYLVDIYRGDAKTGSFLDCILYLIFFPKIISGPIVLWKDFVRAQDVFDLHRIVVGINLIIIGLVKKVLFADQFGACMRKMPANEITAGVAWGGALLYMLEIYFDFAGYSDIATGVAKLFGYDFTNNFNFPYKSLSITEFWRRWHISLGVWFKEYVYFPLGGSKKGSERTLLNLAAVFFLTGVWHGAGWAYLAWGGINGFFVLLERILKGKKIYERIPACIKWTFSMFVVLMFWEFFRFGDFAKTFAWYKIMFGLASFKQITYELRFFFDNQIIFLVIMAIVGSVLPKERLLRKYEMLVTNENIRFLLNETLLIILFVVALMGVVNSTYAPFIYFQF